MAAEIFCTQFTVNLRSRTNLCSSIDQSCRCWWLLVWSDSARSRFLPTNVQIEILPFWLVVITHDCSKWFLGSKTSFEHIFCFLRAFLGFNHELHFPVQIWNFMFLEMLIIYCSRLGFCFFTFPNAATSSMILQHIKCMAENSRVSARWLQWHLGLGFLVCTLGGS